MMDPNLVRRRDRPSTYGSPTGSRGFSGLLWRLIPMALGLVSIVGLTRCSSPTDPPEPPAGGRDFVLSFDEFVTSVVPVLEEHGCNAVGDCHGGGIRGTYELSPADGQNQAFDFEQTVLQVFPFALEQSPILVKPLDELAGGERHGFEPFASVEDPGYIAIREWVYRGTFR